MAPYLNILFGQVSGHNITDIDQQPIQGERKPPENEEMGQLQTSEL